MYNKHSILHENHNLLRDMWYFMHHILFVSSSKCCTYFLFLCYRTLEHKHTLFPMFTESVQERISRDTVCFSDCLLTPALWPWWCNYKGCFPLIVMMKGRRCRWRIWGFGCIIDPLLKNRLAHAGCRLWWNDCWQRWSGLIYEQISWVFI